jgi:hypothetical protein
MAIGNSFAKGPVLNTDFQNSFPCDDAHLPERGEEMDEEDGCCDGFGVDWVKLTMVHKRLFTMQL